jgi:uncharacterized membrane protein YfcA
MDLTTLAFLMTAGFFAGLVVAMAGGGGLISLPALVAAGIPPHTALATNKVQSAIGTTMSAWRYAHAGHIERRIALTGFIAAFAGSMSGAFVVMQVSGESLESLIPAMIIVVGVITFVRKNFGAHDTFTEASAGTLVGAAAFAFALGFYDGFFGPGTGSFLAFGFILFFQFGFVRATGNAKVTNLASNYAAIVAFVIGGHVAWTAALAMGAMNITGAWIGAGLAMRGGVRIIKPVFGVVLVALLVKILFFS